MSRQMFAKGGAAGFPDLSGDGKVTQRDILMGRGVPMQMGGEPMAAQMAAMPPPMDGAEMPPAPPMAGMPPAPPMAGMPVPPEMPMEQAAMAAMEKGIDPGVLEGMLQQAAGSFGNLDAAAETDDYEQVINSIRGDDMPLQERRMELAGVVGDADAAQTPDSVLTLVQPIMQIAAVDQGIGSMAPEAMNTPIEGDMAGGIMSTVNMAEEEPMPGPGGPAPVNFNQGGPVIEMQEGGSPVGGRLGEIYQDKQALYKSILSPENQQEALEKQKNMTEAQMLFDIAQGGLMFATPGERSMSPAARLAQSFTPVLGNISARAGELQQFEQGLQKEQRALDLTALGAAESTLTAENKAAVEADEAERARTFDLVKMREQFDFTKNERLATQDYNKSVQDRKFANDQALVALEADNSKSATLLRNQLERENLKLQSELRKGETLVNFENTLKRDGVQNAFELSKMAEGHELNVALADHRAELADFAAANSQAFQAAQRVLDRADRRSELLTRQAFEKRMAEELRDFQGSQADKDRLIRDAQLALDDKYKMGSLDVAEAGQALDERYKTGKLALEEAAAKVTKLGSDAKTQTINYLTDAERLDNYANGNLGDEATTFEQLVLDYIDPKNSEVWDAELGRYVKGSATQLAPRVLQALKSGNPEFYGQISDALNLDAAPPSAAGEPSADAAGEPSADAAGEPSAVSDLTLGDATTQIFNLDGTVNENSEVWRRTAPNRFDKTVDYGKAIGLSRVMPTLRSAFSEAIAEVAGGEPSPEAQQFRKAQATLTGFANDLLTFQTNLQGQRVLKFVQELIEKETENLRAGGFFFKTDADAIASLAALRDGFEQAMQIEAAKIPEYGGDSSGYSRPQVTGARNRINNLKVLYNEIRAFEDGFKEKAKPPVTEEDRNENLRILQGLMKRKKKSEGN